MLGLLFVHAQLPIFEQFSLVEFHPIEYQHLGASGQLACSERQRINVNGRFEFCIFDMKMRRRVVIEIHSDDEALKETDGGHN